MATSGDDWYYDIPCFVFTHHHPAPLGEGVRVVSGPPADHHAEIVAAADGRDIWVVGGGGLAADWAEAGLLDEVQVSIAPVTLGAGRPLFPRPFDLELMEVDRNRAFVCAWYRVVGPR
jgi:dihydrofolate reductase